MSAVQISFIPAKRAVSHSALLRGPCLYSALPALIGLGLSPFDAYIVSFTVPCALLFALGVGFARQDIRPFSWSKLAARLRLVRMTGRDWLWAAATFVLTFLITGALAVTSQFLIAAVPLCRRRTA